jgi:hypothetical protein
LALVTLALRCWWIVTSGLRELDMVTSDLRALACIGLSDLFPSDVGHSWSQEPLASERWPYRPPGLGINSLWLPSSVLYIRSSGLRMRCLSDLWPPNVGYMVASDFQDFWRMSRIFSFCFYPVTWLVLFKIYSNALKTAIFLVSGFPQNFVFLNNKSGSVDN